MKRIKKSLAGVLLAATAGGTLLLAAAPASAAAPGWEPDPNSNGTVTFYDAAGNVITGGNNLSHLFAYASASSAEDPAGFHKAAVFFAFPNHTLPNTLDWFSSSASATTPYPVASPASLAALPATTPVVTAGVADVNLSAALGGATLDATAGYANIVQVRVQQSGGTNFWAADIQYDKTAGTWQQVFPAVAATSVSAISASTANPAPAGTTSVNLSATLTASDASHPAGSVHLFNGASDLGAATFNAATGAISATATVANSTSYAFKFVYTPSVAVVGSQSPVLTYRVATPAVVTSTVLSGPTATSMGTPVTIHADVKDGATPAAAVPATAGKVQFKVDGVNAGAAVALGAAGADYLYNPASQGSHTITADFVPTDPAVYLPSSDAIGVTINVSAPLTPTDTVQGNVTTTVAAGTLTISTPYTVENPFKLGTMNLSADGQILSASANFGDPTVPGAVDPGKGALGHTPLATYPAATVANGVTITDQRPGSTGWTAYAQTSDFKSSTTTSIIPGDNLTFTGVKAKYPAGNALTGKVNPHDITNFGTVKKSFADTTAGPGTVNIYGVIGLTAATSTLPGDYTATVTFTIY